MTNDLEFIQTDNPKEFSRLISDGQNINKFFLTLNNAGNVSVPKIEPQQDCKIFIVLSGTLNIEFKFNITKEIKTKIYFLSLTKENDIQIINIESVISSKNSHIELNSLAFIKDSASRKINFNTRILAGAADSKIQEKDEAILLSEMASTISIPALRSSEDSADCTHQFYAGKINQKQLNFLETRSIDKKKALLLLSQSKVAPEMRDYFFNHFRF